MNHVYGVTEIVGSSTESNNDAIRQAVAKASETLRNLEWYEVTTQRGHIENGQVAHFQLAIKVGFRCDT